MYFVDNKEKNVATINEDKHRPYSMRGWKQLFEVGSWTRTRRWLAAPGPGAVNENPQPRIIAV
jgi:hypothetical protein